MTRNWVGCLVAVVIVQIGAGCGGPTQSDLAIAIKDLQAEEARLESAELSYEVAKEDCLQILCKDVAGLDYFLLQKQHLQSLDSLAAESHRTLRDAQAMLSGHEELASDESKLGISSRKIHTVRERLDETGDDLEKAEAIVKRAQTEGTKENALYKALLAQNPKIKEYKRQQKSVEEAKVRADAIRTELESVNK